jgi:hypothetical protein
MRGKRGLRRTWIARVALATLVLAGGVYAAEQATAPAQAEDVNSVINAQRIKQGVPVSTKAEEDLEHQLQSLAPAQMAELATRYDKEMRAAVEHAEGVRITAYRQRDIIRISCIDDKLVQMRDVIRVAEPRVATVTRMQAEELMLRQHFLIVQEARKRIDELAAEVLACMGEGLDAISAGRVRDEAPSDAIVDPTRPPTPTSDTDRPPEASPYR